MQLLLNTRVQKKGGDVLYNAWSSMSQLERKGLVCSIKQGTSKLFLLSKDGIALAKLLHEALKNPTANNYLNTTTTVTNTPKTTDVVIDNTNTNVTFNTATTTPRSTNVKRKLDMDTSSTKRPQILYGTDFINDEYLPPATTPSNTPANNAITSYSTMGDAFGIIIV